MSNLGTLAKLGEKNPMWSGKSKFLPCSNCKKMVWRIPSQIKKLNFCSSQCTQDYRKINISKDDLIREYVINNKNLELVGKNFNCGYETIRTLLIKYNIKRHTSGCTFSGENHPTYKSGKPHCIDCGEELSAYHCVRCIDCSNKGKLNSNYIHGLSKESYPYEFLKKRPDIFKRDIYICQHCGMTENEHLIKYNTKLHVHHIDYNKFNNENQNLITTCMICNIKANGNPEHDRDYWYAYYTYIMEQKQ